jgi:hypothetical protein
MIPVSRFMPDALAALLRKAPLNDDKVAFAWRSAVGPAVDRNTRIQLQDHVLHVRAQGRAWQHEVERSVTLIRSRLDALLGDDVVHSIDVRCE